jgi:hypothetical protein
VWLGVCRARNLEEVRLSIAEPRLKGARVTRKNAPALDSIEDAEQYLDQIIEAYTCGPEHLMLIAAARAAVRRWLEIKVVIDREGVLLPGRYENSTRAHPLLAPETKARTAAVVALEKVARILA